MDRAGGCQYYEGCRVTGVKRYGGYSIIPCCAVNIRRYGHFARVVPYHASDHRVSKLVRHSSTKVLHYWIEHACGVLARSRCETSPHLRKYHPIEFVRLNAQLSMVSFRSEACPSSAKQVNSFDAGIGTARSLVLALSEPAWTSASLAPAECLGGSYRPISTLAKSR